MQFPDWCGTPPTDANRHLAIGRFPGRNRANGSTDTAQCSIFHVWFDITSTQPLVSVTLPPQTNNGGVTQAYLMALTLQAGAHVRDARTSRRRTSSRTTTSAPQSQATLDSDRPQRRGLVRRADPRRR